MELIQMQPTGKTPITQCIPVFIITKEGKSYNAEGIKFVKDGIEKHFNVHNDLVIYSGIGINDAKTLATFIEQKTNSYVILSTKDDVVFIPQNNNKHICYNLREQPDKPSWEILMESCHLELY